MATASGADVNVVRQTMRRRLVRRSRRAVTRTARLTEAVRYSSRRS